VDVLGLGMLTCIRKAFELIERHHHRKLTLATIPAEDPEVYDMICKADTLGVFQIESRAQMTMLPRLRPRKFYDLVIEVAIVRPGPIIGDMVHPYLRRRSGDEPPYYPDDKVRSVLEKTLGVPLFQEQAMSLAIVAAGFTPGEAEQLRRAITAWKSNKQIAGHMDRFLRGMLDNGYSRNFAEWCFQRMKGFSEYGFPESHAASFALLVYASSWLKCYHPAVFAAALINSQPMGFYAPAQIIRDARDHGVTVRAVDVNHSAWDCTLEDGGRVLRMGMRMIKGLRHRDARMLIDAVDDGGPFHSVVDLWRASGVNASVLRPLAQADAFRSMGLDRQQALWRVQALRGKPLPLFDCTDPATAAAAESASDAPLPQLTLFDHVGHDYATVGLSLKAHPMSFLRESLQSDGVLTSAQMKDESFAPHTRFVAVAGVVLFRQRPSTAKGVMFMTLEDETGRADLIVKPRIYERFREAVIFGKVILAKGRVESRDGVVHMMVHTAQDISRRFERLPEMSRDFR